MSKDPAHSGTDLTVVSGQGEMLFVVDQAVGILDTDASLGNAGYIMALPGAVYQLQMNFGWQQKDPLAVKKGLDQRPESKVQMKKGLDQRPESKVQMKKDRNQKAESKVQMKKGLDQRPESKVQRKKNLG